MLFLPEEINGSRVSQSDVPYMHHINLLYKGKKQLTYRLCKLTRVARNRYIKSKQRMYFRSGSHRLGDYLYTYAHKCYET